MPPAPPRVPTNTHLESYLERFFRHQVRLLGGMVVKLTAASETGVPDRLVFLHGRTYLVELKTEDGHVSPKQAVWHRKIRATGNRVHVLYGQDGCLAWLRIVTDGAAARPGSRTRQASRTG